MVKVQADASTEEKILTAARKVFITNGLAGARMQEIADEAGINKAMLHYYFRSKEKLFETVLVETMQGFVPKMNSIFNSDAELEEKIKTFCAVYIDKMVENPFIPLFVMNEINKQPEAFFKKLWGGKKPDVSTLVKQIEVGVKNREISPIHPVQLVMNIMALCVFPFVAKPMFQLVMAINDKQFRLMMEERKKEVPKFIINAIKK
jgi:AcrR family transcriptional regulator